MSKAKETGFAHWASPNAVADNSSGFTALPAGARYVNDTAGSCSGATPVYFSGLGYYSPWWTSTTSGNPNHANFREMDYNSTRMWRNGGVGCIGYSDKRTGYSVRLVKD